MMANVDAEWVVRMGSMVMAGILILNYLIEPDASPFLTILVVLWLIFVWTH